MKTSDGNTDAAIAALVRLLTLGPFASERKARAAVDALIKNMDDEGAFCELVNNLTAGKSDTELAEQAQDIAFAAFMAGAEAASRRIDNLRAEFDKLNAE